MKAWIKISTDTQQPIKDQDGNYLLFDRQIMGPTAHLGYVFVPVKVSRIYERHKGVKSGK